MKNQLMKSFLNFSVNITIVGCLLLSKSSIEICENTGAADQVQNPLNVVREKSCEKKMVVLMSIRNNQGETEKLQAVVSVVQDGTSNEFARLYNPFMITVSKSPVLINFPFFFNGRVVNNRPYEEVIKSSNAWYLVDSSKQCYDQWQPVEKEDKFPACGYQYTTETIKQNDGTYKIISNRIFDSQGFCCFCTNDEKNSYALKYVQNNKRSGITCKLATNAPQASAHCMRMDKLWYTLNDFTESYRDFSIYVRAFDQVQKVIQNRTIIDYVNGGEIVLGPSQKSGVGSYERIVGTYVGDFDPIKSYPVLTNTYFLIPKNDSSIDPTMHPQLMGGISKWMIIPRDLVSVDAKQCDMIGVSYSSFKNQAASGIGYGCAAQQGSCLRNQPYDKFMEDQERLKNGKMPWYFPARYGKLAGVKKKDGMEDAYLLSYELEEQHTSLVTLQISADDIILVYNRATGEIARVAVKDFEALSMDGKLFVDVINTGYVTSDFRISIPGCSEGIQKVEEKSVTIDPQITQTVTFSLMTTSMTGQKYGCIIQLFDSKGMLLGQRNISFTTTTPCICEVQTCHCACSEGGGVKCVDSQGKSELNQNLFEAKSPSLFSIIMDGITSFPSVLAKFVGNMFGSVIAGLIQSAIYGIIVVVLLVMCCKCGGLKLFKRIICPSGKKKYIHVKSQLKQKTKKKKSRKENDDVKKPTNKDEETKKDELETRKQSDGSTEKSYDSSTAPIKTKVEGKLPNDFEQQNCSEDIVVTNGKRDQDTHLKDVTEIISATTPNLTSPVKRSDNQADRVASYFPDNVMIPENAQKEKINKPIQALETNLKLINSDVINVTKKGGEVGNLSNDLTSGVVVPENPQKEKLDKSIQALETSLKLQNTDVIIPSKTGDVVGSLSNIPTGSVVVPENAQKEKINKPIQALETSLKLQKADIINPSKTGDVVGNLSNVPTGSVVVPEIAQKEKLNKPKPALETSLKLQKADVINPSKTGDVVGNLSNVPTGSVVVPEIAQKEKLSKPKPALETSLKLQKADVINPSKTGDLVGNLSNVPTGSVVVPEIAQKEKLNKPKPALETSLKLQKADVINPSKTGDLVGNLSNVPTGSVVVPEIAQKEKLNKPKPALETSLKLQKADVINPSKTGDLVGNLSNVPTGSVVVPENAQKEKLNKPKPALETSLKLQKADIINPSKTGDVVGNLSNVPTGSVVVPEIAQKEKLNKPKPALETSLKLQKADVINPSKTGDLVGNLSNVSTGSVVVPENAQKEKINKPIQALETTLNLQRAGANNTPKAASEIGSFSNDLTSGVAISESAQKERLNKTKPALEPSFKPQRADAVSAAKIGGEVGYLSNERASDSQRNHEVRIKLDKDHSNYVNHPGESKQSSDQNKSLPSTKNIEKSSK